jgi:protein-S-isoprenylcysteine O-methyltransferase Ste14
VTDCEECSRFEAPPPTRGQIAISMLASGLARLPPFRPSPASQMISHMGMVMALQLGSAVQEPTWYEKHRQRWIETGDRAELDRMLRHPLPPQPVYQHQPKQNDRLSWFVRHPALVPLGAVLASAGILVVMWQVFIVGWLW